MKALRPDEDSLDATHSVYVDQWDWEAVINKSDRTVETLKEFCGTYIYRYEVDSKQSMPKVQRY